MKSRFIIPILLALLLGGFILGVIALFQLRFNAGDIYPPYSSLRADPLGVKVLYESLQDIPGLTVSRFYQASGKLAGGKDRVLFLFGVDRENIATMSEEDFNAVQRFMFNGGRVVLSLLPEAAGNSYRSHLEHQKDKGKKSKPNGDTNSPEPVIKYVSMLDKFGFSVGTEPIFDGSASNRATLSASSVGVTGLPESVSWHSAAFFSDLDAHWRPIYQRQKKAVVMERPLGAGSLVLASDSFLASNEALRRERQAALLSWLIGARNEILFDETHLGVEEQVGVATLMQRYHLEGVVFGFILVAALFVWQNSAPFVPPFADEIAASRSATVQGRQSTAGFASLLRRNIPPNDLLTVCFTEWKNACARQPRAAARMEEIEAIVAAQNSLPPKSRRPLDAWEKIHRLLTERR